jgi:hypothetical protein
MGKDKEKKKSLGTAAEGTAAGRKSVGEFFFSSVENCN